MGIFDNVTSVTIDDKAVKSITIDGGTVYEAEVEPTLFDVIFTVVDASTSEAISGATVTYEGTDKTTDSNGQCTFDDISEGSIFVNASATGYVTGSLVQVSVDSEHTSFTINLTAETPSEPQVTTQ